MGLRVVGACLCCSVLGGVGVSAALLWCGGSGVLGGSGWVGGWGGGGVAVVGWCECGGVGVVVIGWWCVVVLGVWVVGCGG